MADESTDLNHLRLTSAGCIRNPFCVSEPDSQSGRVISRLLAGYNLNGLTPWV